MDANTYPAEPHRLPQKSLWFGFGAAPIAWAIQGLVGVMVSAQFCPANTPGWAIMGETGVRIVLGIITLCLLAVAISAGVTSFRNWRLLAGHRELVHAEGINREAFMSLGGVLISTVFTVALLWAGIPIVMLSVCERGR